jgi:hypothetical protein
VITGIRRILKEVVGPEVASEYALSRLEEVRAVLAQVNWNDAALQLRNEVITQRRLLAQIASWASDAPDRVAHFVAVPDVPSGDAVLPETYGELEDLYRTEAAVLVEAHRLLAVWTRTHPEEQAAQELRSTVLVALSEEPASR